ncbi:MAG: serine/threonine protein kinase, partial [Selenomonadaceae bacterium]|nr:serine/threonine protein kinase [Selenomonadaceae bacterium]
MDSLERYLGDTYELVDTLKSSEQGFVAVVYDKRAKRLCTMKQRTWNSLPIYKTLKELNNPHVPQIYRLIERDGKLIVVEEHIDGQTLEEFLIYRQLDETLAEKILLQLCDSLSILHERNIIHRDLKPSNIMLTVENAVKLIDFGIARFFKPESTADTELMGTRGYAPLEQFGLFDFGQTDRRSDIYALGLTIKNLLGKDY